ncbi:deoxyribose-phosphate aldolase [Chthonobacter rhizosphaerae]|uniref:deoxyribose-phosphate aldolase n=1 Tax=Chthonobacter rhizosphaerae TaxID=2735553 RepID=UPI0015EE529B|nr:deoxyribose-phosphate aldolase [Chthonobacter rhizosphaerae]
MESADAVAVARRAIGLLDLTDLSDECTPAAVDRLCARAVTPHGSVAAVCLYPRFVAQAKRLLAGTGVKVATVVNFPAGGEDTPAVLSETRAALDDGADEIDLVMPYRAFREGRPEVAREQIALVADIVRAKGARLKVILETGELGDLALVRSAAELAVEAGADFLKTSTGKVKVNASVEAARVMLDVIARSGRQDLGFKPAGGIRTLEDAANYLSVADAAMGSAWARPSTFRFGASGLLDALVATLEGRQEDGGTGY